MKALLLSFFTILFFSASFAQQIQQSKYVIETSLDGKSTRVYDDNYCSAFLNFNKGEVSFSTNIADLKTGDAKTDSLLQQRERITLAFKGTLQDLSILNNGVNDDTYHKVEGTLMVDNDAYLVEAYIKIDNFTDRSNLSKALMDYKMTIDPKKINIPYLSAYFPNEMVFELNDGIINQAN